MSTRSTTGMAKRAESALATRSGAARALVDERLREGTGLRSRAGERHVCRRQQAGLFDDVGDELGDGVDREGRPKRARTGGPVLLRRRSPQLSWPFQLHNPNEVVGIAARFLERAASIKVSDFDRPSESRGARCGRAAQSHGKSPSPCASRRARQSPLLGGQGLAFDALAGLADLRSNVLSSTAGTGFARSCTATFEEVDPSARRPRAASAAPGAIRHGRETSCQTRAARRAATPSARGTRPAARRPRRGRRPSPGPGTGRRGFPSSAPSSRAGQAG